MSFTHGPIILGILNLEKYEKIRIISVMVRNSPVHERTTYPEYVGEGGIEAVSDSLIHGYTRVSA